MCANRTHTQTQRRESEEDGRHENDEDREGDLDKEVQHEEEQWKCQHDAEGRLLVEVCHGDTVFR